MQQISMKIPASLALEHSWCTRLSSFRSASLSGFELQLQKVVTEACGTEVQQATQCCIIVRCLFLSQPRECLKVIFSLAGCFLLFGFSNFGP